MYLIAIAWLYVALMMAAAEATNTQGSVLGGVFTFALYGVGPVALVLDLMGSPARRRARLRQAQEDAAAARAAPLMPSAPSVGQPDGSGHAAGTTVTPEGKEP
jgi:hypothetical protein